jgi:hypothetical protein
MTHRVSLDDALMLQHHLGHPINSDEGSYSHMTGTACWPCRQRKVKCDNKSPCENCVKREHPQLCSYKPNRSATGKSISSLSEQPTPAKKRARSPDERDTRRSLSNEAREAISAYGA